MVKQRAAAADFLKGVVSKALTYWGSVWKPIMMPLAYPRMRRREHNWDIHHWIILFDIMIVIVAYLSIACVCVYLSVFPSFLLLVKHADSCLIPKLEARNRRMTKYGHEPLGGTAKQLSESGALKLESDHLFFRFKKP